MKQNLENQSYSMQNVYALKDVINSILLYLTEFKQKKSIAKKRVKGQMLNNDISEKEKNFTWLFIPSGDYEDPNDLLVAGEFPKINTECIKWNKALKRWEH